MTIALNVSTALAIYDYATLVSEIADQLDRDDLSDKMGRFVQLVEANLRRRLRTMDMETAWTTQTSSESVTLPTDFLQLRSLQIEGSTYPDYPLRGMSPAALAQEFSGQSASVPVAYAIIGDTLKLAPPPSGTITLAGTYLAKFTPLTATSVTNWVLDDHPDIYFYGVLMQAEAYVDNPEKIVLWKAAFDEAVEALIRVRARDRFGSGPLVPNTVRQVRGAAC